MFKNWEMVLYFVTGFFCFVLGILSIGYPEIENPVTFVARRNAFYIVELVLLVIVYIRCGKLLNKYDSDYFETTKKIFHGAEICFVLVAIVTVFAVVEAVPTFIMMPRKAFSGGINGVLVLLAFSGVTWVFYNVTSSKYRKVIEKKAQEDNPSSEKLEDFFAFIHGMDEKQEEKSQLTADTLEPDEMPDASALLDDAEPDLQQMPIIDHISVPAELWECPLCGSLNPNNSRQCDFCGAQQKRKEDNDDVSQSNDGIGS